MIAAEPRDRIRIRIGDVNVVIGYKLVFIDAIGQRKRVEIELPPARKRGNRTETVLRPRRGSEMVAAAQLGKSDMQVGQAWARNGK